MTASQFDARWDTRRSTSDSAAFSASIAVSAAPSNARKPAPRFGSRKPGQRPRVHEKSVHIGRRKVKNQPARKPERVPNRVQTRQCFDYFSLTQKETQRGDSGCRRAVAGASNVRSNFVKNSTTRASPTCNRPPSGSPCNSPMSASTSTAGPAGKRCLRVMLWLQKMCRSSHAPTLSAGRQHREVLARPIAVVDSVVDTEVLGQQDVPRIRPAGACSPRRSRRVAAGFSSQVCGFRISTSAKSGQYKELPVVACRNTVPIYSIIP